MKHFSGKLIWITGASSGIGEALSITLAQQGARLILSGRNVESLERVAACCAAAPATHIVPLDLAKASEIPSIASQVIQDIGAPDYVFHNGGISQRSLVMETELEVDRSLMETNFFGTVALTKAILPAMVQNGGGHFIVVTSLVGKIGTPLRSAYAASKHALHGFFDSLRAELGHQNIRVTLVCPGFIRTQISVNALTGNGAKQNKMDDAQANGMSAETCALKILRAVKKGRLETYIGGKEVLGVYLKRFFPRILAKVIAKAKVT